MGLGSQIAARVDPGDAQQFPTDRAGAAPRVFRSMIRTAVSCCVVILMCALPAMARAGDSGKIHWKSVPEGQLKIDDKTPLTWNVYQPDKKKDAYLVLILLGRRYIALDMKSKIAYQVYPGDVQKQGDDLESDDLRKPDRVIPSKDWTLRDVGPAELVRFTLEDYGRTVEVALPHMPDLRAFY